MFENVKVGDEVALISHDWRDIPLRKAVITAVTKTQFMADEQRFLRSDGRGYGASRFWSEPWTAEHQNTIDQNERRQHIRQLRGRIGRCVMRWTLDQLEQATAVLDEAGLMRDDTGRS